MCIAYLALGAHPDWPLFIAANRDEFHRRPCLAAAPWADHPDVIAGIDCQARGTWLGITRQGRFALLTNYRDPASIMSGAPSRGELVSRYLTGAQSHDSYASAVHANAAAYNGFNLIVGELAAASYVANRAMQSAPQALGPGRYII